MTRSNSSRRRARAAALARAERFDPRYPVVLSGVVMVAVAFAGLFLTAA
jgi:hypothetical protein